MKAGEVKEITANNFSCSNIKIWIKDFSHKDKVRFAVYCAELVIDLYDGSSDEPRKAIQAAKNWINDPSDQNKKRCRDTAAVYAAYTAAADAADAAAAAAAYAAYAAADTAAADAADAADAYAAADAADAAAAAAAVKNKIVNWINNFKSDEDKVFEEKDAELNNSLTRTESEYQAVIKEQLSNQDEWKLVSDGDMPQEDFEVICCCDDDVFMATYRSNEFGDYFDNERGVVVVYAWMSKPKVAIAPLTPDQIAAKECDDITDILSGYVYEHDTGFSVGLSLAERLLELGVTAEQLKG